MAELDPLAFQRGFQSSQSMFDQRRQNKLQDLLMGQKTREIENENKLASAYSSAYSTDGTLDRNKLRSGLAGAGLGHKIPTVETQFAQQDKAQREAEKAQLEGAIQKQGVVAQYASAATDQASWEAGLSELARMGIDVSQVPRQYSQETAAMFRNRALTGVQQLEQVWKQKEFDQKQSEFAYRQGNDQQNRDVTMRGQDMTDSRARDANALQSDAKLLQVEAAQDKQREREQSKQAAISSAEDSLAILDKALDHPGREAATGKSSILNPTNYIPGTEAKNFQVVLDQIKGQAFLQAFQNLKGGGQITEVEGKKATDAIGRLDRAQSDEEFKVALQDLRGVMQRGYDRLKGSQSGSSGAKKIGSKAEYDAMPSGTLFVAPDGTTRRKP